MRTQPQVYFTLNLFFYIFLFTCIILIIPSYRNPPCTLSFTLQSADKMITEEFGHQAYDGPISDLISTQSSSSGLSGDSREAWASGAPPAGSCSSAGAAAKQLLKRSEKTAVDEIISKFVRITRLRVHLTEIGASSIQATVCHGST